MLVPSDQFANSGVRSPAASPSRRSRPAATYYIPGNQLKVILDFPLLINAPVFTEPTSASTWGRSCRTRRPCSPQDGRLGRAADRAQARLMFQAQF